MPHHRPKYKDYWWDDLPEDARKAAAVLGWDEKEKWDKSVDTDFRNKTKFEELTLIEKQAAIFLQIDLFGKFLDIWWSEVDPETKKACLALDWKQDKWDHDWALWDLEVDHKYWADMTDEEKSGAMHFGYTHHTWDEDLVEEFDVDSKETPVTLPELSPEEKGDDDEEEEEEEEEVVVESAEATEAPVSSAATTSGSTKKAKKFKISRQYGGEGGEPFDHKNHRRIQKVTVYSGRRYVDAIQVTYENGKSIKSGGDGGDPETLELASGEWIVAVDVRYGNDGIQCLTFTTNKGSALGPCGGSGGMLGKSGEEIKLKAPATMKLVGVKGRKGARLDAIAMRWGPAKAS